jgi:type VI secretion system protein ImpA
MDAKILSAVKLDESSYKLILQPLKNGDKKVRADAYLTLIEKIKQARFEEDELLPQGVWKRDYKKADWHLVSELCLTALQEHSKDLQVLGWITESWFKSFGIQGALAGVSLIMEVVDLHWTDLLPPLDGEDDEYRQSSINWLNDRLAELIKFSSITKTESSLTSDYTFADWELSVYYDRVNKKSASARKQATQSKPLYAKLEEIESAIAQTPLAYHEKLKKNFAEFFEVLQTFETTWRQHSPKTLGLFKKTREVTQQIISFIDAKLLKRSEVNKLQDAKVAKGSAQEQVNQGDTQVKTESSNRHSFSFTNEAEAYEALLQIAAYLGEKHPHSPAPFLIQQAVEMGQLSFVEVMKRFSQDPGLKIVFEGNPDLGPITSKK